MLIGYRYVGVMMQMAVHGHLQMETSAGVTTRAIAVSANEQEIALGAADAIGHNIDVHGGSVSSGDVVVLLQNVYRSHGDCVWLVEKMYYPAGVATLARWTLHAC